MVVNQNKSSWQKFYDSLQWPHLVLIVVLALSVCIIGAIVVGSRKQAIDDSQARTIYGVVNDYERIKVFQYKLRTDNNERNTREFLSFVIDFKTDTTYKFWTIDSPQLKEVLDNLDRAEKDMKELKVIAERVQQNINRHQVISDEDIEDTSKLLSHLRVSTDRAYEITRRNR